MKKLIMAIATLLFAVGCNCNQPKDTAQNQPTHNYTAKNYSQNYTAQNQPTQNYSSGRQGEFVGPQGADGPAGAKGSQGPTGQTGVAGYAVAGPQGPEGPTGAMGDQGPMGARGPSGNLVVGPAGVTGPAGNPGDQGQTGQTGVQGVSSQGYAGPIGSSGQTGAQGSTGDSGVKGATLVGPAGPAGRIGPSGERGDPGQIGAQGSTTAGVAGATGISGAAGPQGPKGPTGPAGLTGVVERWISYRDFMFDSDKAEIHDADKGKVAEIAAYMKGNPSLQLGIDGATNSQAAEGRDQDLLNRRVNAVRDALVQAGVSSDRISDGIFGDVNLRRNGRVEVLIKTNRQMETVFSPVGSTGVVERWISYRDFMFDPDKSVMHDAEKSKVTEIASYMKGNPSLQLGIDGTTNPQATEGREEELLNRRVKTVRDALVQAGVSSDRISDGTFGDVNLRRNGRVEVLIKTDRLTQAPFTPAGSTGDIGRWANYQNFWFDANTAVIHPGDMSKVYGIAAHLKQNQSLHAGIDSSMNPDSSDPSKIDLAKRRGDAIRDALIAAGVPAGSIESGVFGDSRIRRDGQVEVLIRTQQMTQSQ